MQEIQGRKLKTARTLMTIILISTCGWVAVIHLVIKPPFWLGGILSIIGGIVIGTAVVYLMRRWWFRRPLADRMSGQQNFTNIVDELKCPACGGEKFQLGPRGGAAQNIRCVCGHELNVCRLPDKRWWVEDITPSNLMNC